MIPPGRNGFRWTSELSTVPAGKYTFRTTFELADVSPESAVLLGRFLADNHVDAIRLNGHAVPVPATRFRRPVHRVSLLHVRKGFVTGINVLEIDVFNSPPVSAEGSPIPWGSWSSWRVLRVRGLAQ